MPVANNPDGRTIREPNAACAAVVPRESVDHFHWHDRDAEDNACSCLHKLWTGERPTDADQAASGFPAVKSRQRPEVPNLDVGGQGSGPQLLDKRLLTDDSDQSRPCHRGTQAYETAQIHDDTFYGLPVIFAADDAELRRRQ